MTEFKPLKFESLDKKATFKQARQMVEAGGFRIIEIDFGRPWGFFISIDESQAPDFINYFYRGTDFSGIDTSLPMRHKILGMEPGRRLSLQTHDRRNEIWRGLAGPFSVALGKTEASLTEKIVEPGQVVLLPQGIIHRGIGLGSWGIAAEIWQHTDPAHPSNEDDIIRLQDDFGRS